MLLQRAAPAKLNLGLHVLRRRADGYHDLETVFVRIDWADHLTAAPAERLSLTCSDPVLPTDGSNLCLQAAHALARTYEVEGGARLHLDKHVPYGAGLGGGSSDAAATLRLLAALWQLPDDPDRLHAIAAGLGADVPFFLGPEVAFGEGRGERLTPLLDIEGEPYRLPFRLVVAVPPERISTAEAYGLVAPDDRDRPDLAAAVRSNDLDRWEAELVNDFEAPIFRAYPAVEHVKEALLDAGAGYASLSGSGSAVFGVFEGGASATAAAEALRLEGFTVWAG